MRPHPLPIEYPRVDTVANPQAVTFRPHDSGEQQRGDGWPKIVAISPNLSTGRKLSVVWGVHCVIAQDARDLDDVVDRACRMAVRDGFAKIGQRIIIVAGVPLRTPGATNMMRLAFVGDEAAESVPLFQAAEDRRQKTGV